MIDRLNLLQRDAAEAALLACCGSRAWARQMAAARPFAHEAALFEAADRIWWNLAPADWREAFGAHPRIGEQASAGLTTRPPAAAERWPAEEQAGAAAADPSTRAALENANHQYEQRFGHIFIVCATGKTASEMLALLTDRLGNDPDGELRIAADEQRKITRLRLEKLLRRD